MTEVWGSNDITTIAGAHFNVALFVLYVIRMLYAVINVALVADCANANQKNNCFLLMTLAFTSITQNVFIRYSF